MVSKSFKEINKTIYEKGLFDYQSLINFHSKVDVIVDEKTVVKMDFSEIRQEMRQMHSFYQSLYLQQTDKEYTDVP